MNNMFQLELEDVRAFISEMGGDPEAFAFLLKNNGATHMGPLSTHYLVVAVHQGMQLQYQGGYGEDWVGRFADDVRRGVFGPSFKRPPADPAPP